MKTLRQILESLVEAQHELAYEYPPLLTFTYGCTAIYNPFLDESGMISVDPYTYYGDYFLNSSIYNIATVMFENQ